MDAHPHIKFIEGVFEGITGIEHNLKEFEEHIIKVFEDLAAIVHELHSSAGLWAKVKEACAQIGKLIKDLYHLFTDHVIEEIKEGMEKLASIVHDIIDPLMWHKVLARDAIELVEEEAEDWLEWKDNKYYTQITTLTASYKSGDTFTCGKTVGSLCVEFL